jgi:hypothetical protein
MDKSTILEEIEISVETLSYYCDQKGIKKINLMKVDTEGYEFPVLKGLRGYFETTGDRPVIICEIAPAAYKLLGITLQQLEEYMASFGYSAYDILKKQAKVSLPKLTETTNVIFRAQ